MKITVSRSHSWTDAEGREVFRHRKRSDGTWGYAHKLSQREVTSGACDEHGKVAPGSSSCPRKPAVADTMLWNMQAVVKAIESHADILWCEGEKDATAVQAVLDGAGSDAVATSVHQGAAQPVHQAQLDLFDGYTGKVLVFFDKDATGLAHALDRWARLRKMNVSVQMRAIPGAIAPAGAGPGDVSDYIDGKGSLRDCKRVRASTMRRKLRELAAQAARKAGKSPELAERSLTPHAASRGGEGKGGKLEAFREILGPPDRSAGDRDYWRCPHPDHKDSNASFTVKEGKTGAVLLACSCPGGSSRGDDHRDWAGEILEALGLGWEAIKAGDNTGLAGTFGTSAGGTYEGPDPALYPRNDHGNALLLAELHGEDLMYVRERDELMAWDGGKWSGEPRAVHGMILDVIEARMQMARAERDPKAAAIARAFGVSCGNGSRMREMVRASAGTVTEVREAELDTKRRLLPASNGTIELKTTGAIFRPANRADKLTRAASAAWDEDTESPVWAGFLERFVPGDEERAFLQRLMGYSLLGWNPERLVVVISGPTSTGKTTFLSLLMDTLGSGLSGTFQLSMLRTRRDDAPRPDILKAMSRRLIIAEEGSTEWKLHADTIKMLTSGSKIEARGMRSNAFTERTPAFVPVIATNDYPVVQYADAALKRRLVGFPFSVQVPKSTEDAGFRARFNGKDRSAILKWLVDGYNLYCTQGIGEPPGDAKEATRLLRSSLNPIDVFISEFYEDDPLSVVSFSSFWEDFGDWWNDEGLKMADKPTKQGLGTHLTDAGYGRKTLRRNGAPAKVRTGLRHR